MMARNSKTILLDMLVSKLINVSNCSSFTLIAVSTTCWPKSLDPQVQLPTLGWFHTHWQIRTAPDSDLNSFRFHSHLGPWNPVQFSATASGEKPQGFHTRGRTSQITDPKSRASRGTVCIVSDDGDFVETLQMARRERWKTQTATWLPMADGQVYKLKMVMTCDD